MRGFTKAAVSLSSILAPVSAFVIPESAPLSVGGSKPSVEYRPAEALVKFKTEQTQASNDEQPILYFQVDATDKPCGESNVRLNGQQLISNWDGTDAAGSGYFNGIFSLGTRASWNITCLFDTIPADGANSQGKDVAQVLAFLAHSTSGDVPWGFTVSYKQLDGPEIIRLSPKVVDLALVKVIPEEWRARSRDIDQTSTIPETKGVDDELPDFTLHGRKSLQAHLQAVGHFMEEKVNAVKSSVKEMVRSCREHLKAVCPNKANSKDRLSNFLSGSHAMENRPNTVAADHLLEAPRQNETRSTTTLESPETTFSGLPSPSSPPSPSPSFPTISYNDRVHSLKILGLVLVLGSFFAWVILRLRDPRVRADRAARREERHNKLLYRRAAWSQKWKRWFCSVRHHHGQAIGPIGSWDEKRTRVIQQEEILEAVMKEDIRALRNSRRVFNNITAAEEGRVHFIYDSDSSEARRSRDTLPGYESDVTQPPGYETNGVNCGSPTASGRFRYNMAESEDTPDSSVVSTSPRISRDGRERL